MRLQIRCLNGPRDGTMPQTSLLGRSINAGRLGLYMSGDATLTTGGVLEGHVAWWQNGTYKWLNLM